MDTVYQWCLHGITTSPILLKSCLKTTSMKAQSTVNWCTEWQCGVNLYPSRYQAVSCSEDELLGVVCVRWGQEDFAWCRAVSRGQNELLLGSWRRLHCCHYLDLLTCLLVSYNLRRSQTKDIRADRDMPNVNTERKVMLGMYLYSLWCCSGLSGNDLIACWRPTHHWVRRRGWQLQFKTHHSSLNLKQMTLLVYIRLRKWCKQPWPQPLLFNCSIQHLRIITKWRSSAHSPLPPDQSRLSAERADWGWSSRWCKVISEICSENNEP